MPETISYLVFTVLILLSTAVVVLYTKRNLAFLKALNTYEEPISQSPHTSNVLILMCLKGGDPFLKQSITRLASQSYPHCTLRLVIDSESDDSWDIVNPLLEENFPHPIEARVRSKNPETCSGKIANLLDGTQNLDGYDNIMLVDGDSLLPVDAVELFVQRMKKPSIGMVTGNRWYLPSDASAGTILRSQWNGFAVPIMHAYQIPWGGCLMIPAEWLRDCEVRHRLEHSFGEDSFFSAECHARNLEVGFEPQLMIANEESSDLFSLYHFLVRQSLTVRINNPRWLKILGSSLGLSAVFLTMILLSIVPSPIQWGLIGAIAVIAPIVIGQQILLDRQVRKHLGVTTPLNWQQNLMWWTCILNMLPLNTLVTLQAAIKWPHNWRGSTYHFDTENRIIKIERAPSQNVQRIPDPVENLSA